MRTELKTVGVVANPVKNRSDMKIGGTVSVIKIHPSFKPALKGLQACSHIWVLCWFDKADRDVLKARPRKISSTMAERGVFAMRSPDRPNPIALTCAKILKIRGLTIEVDSLDAIDGTPVLDIKPYSHGIDCVPAAGISDFSAKYRAAQDKQLASMLARIALNHTEELTPEVLKALALTFAYVRKSGLAPGRAITGIAASVKGAGLDALYAQFGLRPSDWRLFRSVNTATPQLTVRLGNKRITVKAGPAGLKYFRSLLS
ncbi:MAG: tRNA (N6-threonylcarbamoyladenosine(37)-N6)-methyltransferase TrmO [Elusimicrobiaceae bacterium]